MGSSYFRLPMEAPTEAFFNNQLPALEPHRVDTTCCFLRVLSGFLVGVIFSRIVVNGGEEVQIGWGGGGSVPPPHSHEIHIRSV